MLGHGLQLMPFFLYLWQQLLFGLMQSEVQILSQTNLFENVFVGLFSV